MTNERPPMPAPAFAVGDRVEHADFGPGIVAHVNAATFVWSLDAWTEPGYVVRFDSGFRPEAGIFRYDLRRPGDDPR